MDDSPSTQEMSASDHIKKRQDDHGCLYACAFAACCCFCCYESCECFIETLCCCFG